MQAGKEGPHFTPHQIHQLLSHKKENSQLLHTIPLATLERLLFLRSCSGFGWEVRPESKKRTEETVEGDTLMDIRAAWGLSRCGRATEKSLLYVGACPKTSAAVTTQFSGVLKPYREAAVGCLSQPAVKCL